MGYLDGLRLLSFIRKPRKDPANLVNPVISKFLLDQFRLETEKTSCKSCQEQVLIRQDQQDEQKKSFAFPDERQKGLLNVEMISTRFLKKAVNVDCLLPDNISSQDELVLSFVWKLRKHPVNPV
jgi:hypothetical protein